MCVCARVPIRVRACVYMCACVCIYMCVCVYLYEIPLKILKISIPFIKSPLTYIINKCITNGIFPECLKYSQINPVFKNGDKSDMDNYRPIALLTSFSKIFEKVICKRIYQHVTSNNILASEQHGFRNSSSIETATFIY